MKKVSMSVTKKARIGDTDTEITIRFKADPQEIDFIKDFSALAQQVVKALEDKVTIKGNKK